MTERIGQRQPLPQVRRGQSSRIHAEDRRQSGRGLGGREHEDAEQTSLCHRALDRDDRPDDKHGVNVQ